MLIHGILTHLVEIIYKCIDKLNEKSPSEECMCTYVQLTSVPNMNKVCIVKYCMCSSIDGLPAFFSNIGLTRNLLFGLLFVIY